MNMIHISYGDRLAAVQSDHSVRAQFLYLTCVRGNVLLEVLNQSSFTSRALTVLSDFFNNEFSSNHVFARRKVPLSFYGTSRLLMLSTDFLIQVS